VTWRFLSAGKKRERKQALCGLWMAEEGVENELLPTSKEIFLEACAPK
jgi:hypothetical protein